VDWYESRNSGRAYSIDHTLSRIDSSEDQGFELWHAGNGQHGNVIFLSLALRCVRNLCCALRR
jgi:hypothetical protein